MKEVTRYSYFRNTCTEADFDGFKEVVNKRHDVEV
jgi:hypothetical protein